MGWLYYTLDPGVTPKQELTRMLTWEGETSTNRPLDMHMERTVCYAAVETIIKATGERRVWAAVFLISYSSRGEFGYKDMDEGMGPCESKCPARILDLLTPTDSEWANAWRQRCREYNAAKTTTFIRDATYEFPNTLVSSLGERFNRVVVEGKHHAGRSWMCRTPQGYVVKIGPSIMYTGKLVKT